MPQTAKIIEREETRRRNKARELRLEKMTAKKIGLASDMTSYFCSL